MENYTGPEAENVTYLSGQLWAKMIQNVRDTVFELEDINRFRIAVYGGIDAEGNFNTAKNTIDWVNGFKNTFAILYNVDTAGGCPYEDFPDFGCLPGTPEYNDWSSEKILEISERVIPQIYLKSVSADQWARILKGNETNIRASLTTFQACEQRSDEDAQCADLQNTPLNAWSELYREADFDVRFATDIKWQVE